MVALNHIVIFITLALSGFALSVYINFKNFSLEAEALFNNDIAVLASSNYLTRQTNDYLFKLRKILIDRVQDLHVTRAGLRPNRSEAEYLGQLIQDYRDFIASVNPNLENNFKKTLLYGIELEENNFELESIKIDLINSDKLPKKLNEDGQAYASSLLDDKAYQKIDFDRIKTFGDSGELKLSPQLIELLVDNETKNEIYRSPSFFGINASEDGLDFASLPNGLEVGMYVDAGK